MVPPTKSGGQVEQRDPPAGQDGGEGGGDADLPGLADAGGAQAAAAAGDEEEGG